MIAATWPRSSWYVLSPGLALGALAIIALESAIGTGGLAAIWVVTCTLGLWFRGAIAAFYLREYPTVPINGSAYGESS